MHLSLFEFLGIDIELTPLGPLCEALQGYLTFLARSSVDVSALSITYKAALLRDIPVSSNPALKNQVAEVAFHVSTANLVGPGRLAPGAHRYPFSLLLHPHTRSMDRLGVVVHKLKLQLRKPSRFSTMFPMTYRLNVSREMARLLRAHPVATSPTIPLHLGRRVLPERFAGPLSFSACLYETVTLQPLPSQGMARSGGEPIETSLIITRYSFPLSTLEVDALQRNAFNTNLLVQHPLPKPVAVQPDFSIPELVLVTHMVVGCVRERGKEEHTTKIFHLPVVISPREAGTGAQRRRPRPNRWDSDMETLGRCESALEVRTPLSHRPLGGGDDGSDVATLVAV